MKVKGSSPNVRRATKGGSMSNGKLDGFSQRRRDFLDRAGQRSVTLSAQDRV